MGNILAECQKCSIDQCQICSEVFPTGTGPLRRTPGASGTDAANNHRRGPSPVGGEIAITRSSSAISEEEKLALAIRRAKNEQESKERSRLLNEQAAEYEESLRIDQQRELEKAIKRKEEEEEARKKAQEEEEEHQKAEAEARELAAAEEAERNRIQEIINEACKLLSPEPEKGGSARVDVMIKLPDGRKLKRTFLPSESVVQLYHFANAKGGEAVAGRKYKLVSAMPRCTYEDRGITLESVGLNGQCALMVECTDEED